MPALFAAASEGGDVLGAIESVTGVSIDQLSRDWHAAIAATYRELDPSAVRAAGRPLVTEHTRAANSTSGRHSARTAGCWPSSQKKDLFSVDLYVADARTGQVQRKLTEVATDPHLANIQFLDSAGAWSPDSERLDLQQSMGRSP